MQAAEQQQGLPRRRDYTDELLKAFSGSQVVNPEGSVVDIPFHLPSGRLTALRVSLPAHFPYDRPVLCLLVPLQHQAVDPTGRVHVRGVDQWGAGSSRHLLPQRGNILAGVAPSDLVAVVQEAFEVLLGKATAAKQGLLGESAATGSGGVDSADGSVGRRGRDRHVISLAGGMGGGQVVYGGGSGGSADPVALLEAMPTAKLLQLLETEEELKKAAGSWLKDTPAARALEDVRRQNRTAAEDNLALARSIEEARGHVAIVRSGEYAAMRALFEGLYSRQEAVVAKMGTAKLLARLREEADKFDAAADELLERFQEGSLSIEAFVEQYVAAREAFHISDLKRQAAEHTTLQ